MASELAAVEVLLTSGEAAERLHRHPRTVQAMADEGRRTVAFRTLGGHRRYRASDVEAIARGDV